MPKPPLVLGENSAKVSSDLEANNRGTIYPPSTPAFSFLERRSSLNKWLKKSAPLGAPLDSDICELVARYQQVSRGRSLADTLLAWESHHRGRTSTHTQPYSRPYL